MNTTPPFALALIAVVALTATSARAQSLASLTVGARIRLTTRDSTDSTTHRKPPAIYAGLLRDTLLFRYDPIDNPFAIALSDIQRLQVSTAHRSAWAGAGKGALVGVLVGAVFTLVVYATDTCNDDCFFSPAEVALITGIPVTILTTSIGAIVFSRRQDTWRTVALSR